MSMRDWTHCCMDPDAEEQWLARPANQVKGGIEMKKRIVSSLFVALVALLSTTPAFAQDPVYHVKLDHVGCEDGSQQCPYSTLWEAKLAGEQEICEGRTFEVHKWNSDVDPPQYEYYDTYPGKKPIPGMGLPIAQSLQILLVALAGVFLLVLALRLRAKSAR